jgi:hypothetical protein
MDATKKAALTVGGVAIVGLGIMGAPLWLSLLGGAGAVLLTTKAIDVIAKREGA